MMQQYASLIQGYNLKIGEGLGTHARIVSRITIFSHASNITDMLLFLGAIESFFIGMGAE